MTSASRMALAVSKRAGSTLFGSAGLLGVEFFYFDHFLLAREVVDGTLQTYQAYRMTRLLNRLWLWSPTVGLYQSFIESSRVGIVSDAWRLCSATSCLVLSRRLVSLVIFCSYVPQYNGHRFGFPLYNWYDDEWFVNLVQEFQIMMVVSWGDMASRLVFAAGVLLGMESLKEMLTDSLSAQHSPQANRMAIGPIPQLIASSSDTVSEARAAQPAPPRQERVLHVLIHLVGPVLFVIWGLVILVVHTYAEVHTVNLPCRIPLRPWLSSTPACSLVEIDCHKQKMSGAAESFGDAWTVFDPALAAGLFIRHCPELQVPHSMTLYSGVTTIKMYNTTITSWTIESGFSSTFYPRLRTLFLIRTDFRNGQLPSGLLRSDFPQAFGAFFISKSNLASMPANLDSVWPHAMIISVEGAAMSSIPDSIIRSRPGLLSFSGCPISWVPASLFEIPTLQYLFLSGTAIQELPRDVTKPAKLASLYIALTNVSILWPWVDTLVERSLSSHAPFLFNAVGTPFCAELQQISSGTRERLSAASSNDNEVAALMDISTPSRLAYTEAAVRCVSDYDTIFPLAIQDTLYAIDGIVMSR